MPPLAGDKLAACEILELIGAGGTREVFVGTAALLVRCTSIALNRHHVMLVAVALIPWTSAPAPRPKLIETSVVLYTPSNFQVDASRECGTDGAVEAVESAKPGPLRLDRYRVRP